MDDTVDRGRDGLIKGTESLKCDRCFLNTEQLEDVLFNAIMESAGNHDVEKEGFEDIDEYFSGDEEYEDEAEQRRSCLRLLVTLRPQLAELLGGPHAG